jgi:hypothetical protein
VVGEGIAKGGVGLIGDGDSSDSEEAGDCGSKSKGALKPGKDLRELADEEPMEDSESYLNAASRSSNKFI